MVTQKKKTDFQINIIFAIVLFLVGFPFTALFFDFGKFTSIRILKEITLPFFAIYYSVSWLILYFKIKNLKKEIQIGKSRLIKQLKIKSDDFITTSKEIDQNESKLLKDETNIEYVNISLRIYAIITSILVIINLILI